MALFKNYLDKRLQANTDADVAQSGASVAGPDFWVSGITYADSPGFFPPAPGGSCSVCQMTRRLSPGK